MDIVNKSKMSDKKTEYYMISRIFKKARKEAQKYILKNMHLDPQLRVKYI